MNGKELAVRGVIGAALTFISQQLGGWDTAIQTLVVFLILDMFVGILNAGKKKEVSSSVGFWGVVKKCLCLVLVYMAVRLDILTNANGLVRVTVIYFFVATEGISILENCGELGLPIPAILLDILKKMQDKVDADTQTIFTTTFETESIEFETTAEDIADDEEV